MKKFLLTTVCLFILGGQAYAAPCNAKVQKLQKQVNALVDGTDEMTRTYLKIARWSRSAINVG
jgi:hypothetical protein